MSEFADGRFGVVTGPGKPELTADARRLSNALRDRGAAVEPVVWTDDAVDWRAFDVAVLRSCWAYHERPREFRAWLDRVEDAGVTVLNPPGVVRWNLHKFYLRDLADAGVPVLDTAFVEAGSGTRLADVLGERGWRDAVVKPAVGTSSANTWRTSRSDAGEHEDRFEAMLAEGDVLVQAFAPEVADGELSLVFFGGGFSHAYQCVPAEGEFRSHPSFGGTVSDADPDASVVEQAAAVLDAAVECVDAAPVELPYARVDGVVRDGEFRLMELELIEPALGLEYGENAVAQFADAIEAAVGALAAR